MKLNPRELGTVLAALRLWQMSDLRRQAPDLVEIATDDGEHEPLTNSEIDALCERINR
jgi:hypothetical protein